MELFLDSANIDHIREIASYGIITGVTTNPSLLAKEDPSVDVRDRILEIHQLVGGHCSVEVVSTDAEEMVREAEEILSWFPEATIKIPMIPEGLKATRELARQNVPVNMTLIFSPTQALAAHNAGARYISIFLGRLDDIANDGLRVLADVCEIWDVQGLDSFILAASLRHPMHIVEAARLGANIATVPYAVLKKALHHPLTDAGLEKFLADYHRLQAEIQQRQQESVTT